MSLTKEDLQAIEKLLHNHHKDNVEPSIDDLKNRVHALSEYVDKEFVQINDKIDKLQNEFHAVFRLDENELRVSSGND